MKLDNPISKTLVLIGLYVALLVVASVIGGLIVFFTNDLLSVLILTTLIAFGGSVIVYHKLFDKSFIDKSIFQKPVNWRWVLVAILMYFVSVPLVEYFSDAETDITIFRLCMNASPLKIVALVFGVAVLPAIFEEWFFRGIMQRNLGRIVKNEYIAIVITAAIFSAMHFDFVNFVARFWLGFMLGLMFYWSKSLWVNIIIHFANNLMALIAVLLQAREGIKDYNERVFDNILYIIPSIIAFAVVIYLYEKKGLIKSKS